MLLYTNIDNGRCRIIASSAGLIIGGKDKKLVRKIQKKIFSLSLYLRRLLITLKSDDCSSMLNKIESSVTGDTDKLTFKWVSVVFLSFISFFSFILNFGTVFVM